MANVGTAAAGKTLIGAGNGKSPTYADIGTNSGLTAHGIVIAEGNSAFTVAIPGTSGFVLTSNGAGSDPSFKSISSAGAAISFTGDDGLVEVPDAAGNFNIIGQKASTIAVMDTIGSLNTISREDRAWQTQYVVDASSTNGLRGTFTTIQAAINQAVADGVSAQRVKTIFIRPGTYSESLVMPANSMHLTANTPSGYPVTQDATLYDVTIDGTVNFTAGAVAHFSNVNLVSTANGIVINAANTTNVIGFHNCNIGTGGATAISITANFSYLSLSQTQITGGIISCANAGLANICNSSVLGITASLGSFILDDSVMTGTITLSGSATAVINNGVVTGTLIAGSGTTISVYNSTITTSGTPISGAGTVNTGNVSFIGSGSDNTATTQIPKIGTNDAVKVVTPGAYPYTTKPQDAVILVDTSSARTITPLASPTTGQKHIIKDSVGLAGANNVTITPSGKNIDGVASKTISSNYGSLSIVYNGTEWNVI